MPERKPPAALIRQLRERKGLSQQALARELGTTRHVVMRWENGQQEPSETSARKLATFFRKPSEHFFTPHVAREDRLSAIERRLDGLEAVVASIERHLSAGDEAQGH